VKNTKSDWFNGICERCMEKHSVKMLENMDMFLCVTCHPVPAVRVGGEQK
jgi:hypothetical protein